MFIPVLGWLLLTLVLGAGVWLGQGHPLGREAALTWWLGLALGAILQRARFCFFCNYREAVEEGETRPLLGIVLALAGGTIGAVLLFGAWIPDPSAGYLPPRGHLSPASWPMVAGGAVFGMGMALSGSCISGHLYRLSEGSVTSVVALATGLLGFAAGDAFWNPLYLATYRTASPIWFPVRLGFEGALVLQLVALALIAWSVWKGWQRRNDEAVPSAPLSLWDALFVRRWPWWSGGIGVALVATAALLRTQPLGVTAEFSRLGHRLAESVHGGAIRLEGVEQLRGCVIPAESGFLSQNALLVLALVAGAFVVSLLGRHWEWEWPGWGRVTGAALGGILLGVGSRIALGCTMGTLYGGITALSLSGWLFAGGMLAGLHFILPLRRRWGWNPRR